MLFNSLTFLVFFAGVLALHSLPLPWRVEEVQPAVGQLPVLRGLESAVRRSCSWISTVVDWFVARRHGAGRAAGGAAARCSGSAWSPTWACSAFFKYGGFLLENFQRPGRLLRDRLRRAAAPDIVLPVGISFYTFQTLSYTLDVYRGGMQPCALVPRLRAVRDLLPAAGRRPDRARRRVPARSAATPRRATAAAARLGPVPDDPGPVPEGRAGRHAAGARRRSTVFGVEPRRPAASTPGSAPWPSRARSSATSPATRPAPSARRCASGFSLPDNFRFPYAAIGFSDFWRRWHISLSTWLRDYLYIPLGGNRARARCAPT